MTNRRFPSEHNAIYTDYIKVDVCTQGVGGEILPITTLQLLVPYVLILVGAVGVASVLYKKRLH